MGWNSHYHSWTFVAYIFNNLLTANVISECILKHWNRLINVLVCKSIKCISDRPTICMCWQMTIEWLMWIVERRQNIAYFCLMITCLWNMTRCCIKTENVLFISFHTKMHNWIHDHESDIRKEGFHLYNVTVRMMPKLYVNVNGLSDETMTELYWCDWLDSSANVCHRKCFLLFSITRFLPETHIKWMVARRRRTYI